MPREFYEDSAQNAPVQESQKLCANAIPLFDGPAFCVRPEGHKVDVMTRDNHDTGEFHQEEFEGWIWDNDGAIG